MASKKNGILYIGVTSNLTKRIFEHKEKFIEGFAEKYWVRRLVYYESTTDANEAIKREKQLKKWKREWKIELIEEDNPEWKDLFDQIT